MDDLGTVISPPWVEGQVHGGVVQGVIGALRPPGIAALDRPFTGARVWAAIEAARAPAVR